MLILNRRIGESIQIGDDITITYVQFRGSQISIGIDAPIDIPIVRTEIIGKPIKEKDDTHGNE